MVSRGGVLEETDWTTAMGEVVAVSKRLLADKRPVSLGFYTSGQLFIEEHTGRAPTRLSLRVSWSKRVT